MAQLDLGSTKRVAEREDEGTTIHITDPSGEPMWVDDAETDAVTITVAGAYSSTYRAAIRASQDKQIAKRVTKLDAAGIERQSLDIDAACVLAWHGIVSDGKPLACDKPNVIALLSSAPWVRAQVAAAIHNHADFFGTPSPSSPSA